jgi:glycosyl transferase, family 25
MLSNENKNDKIKSTTVIETKTNKKKSKTPLKLADNIYVINMDESIARMNKIDKLFKNYKINYKRISAVNGKELSNEQIKDNTTKMCRKILCNPGIVGCAMSHLYIWKKLINDNTTDYYIVMEDDVDLDYKFEQTLLLIENLINKGFKFDILSLYCHTEINCQHYSNIINIGEYKIGKTIFPSSNACYIISKRGATKLLSKINKNIHYHIDLQIAFYNLFKHIEYFSIKPNLVNINYDLNSTISASSSSIILFLLDYIGLYKLSWQLRQSVFTIQMKYNISLYLIIIFGLLILFFFLGFLPIIIFLILDLVIYYLSS